MTNYSKYPDDELVALLKQNDQAAFTEIYDRYYAPLFTHVNKMVMDEDLSQDILQEVFIWIFEKAISLEISSSLKTYLYTAVRYKVFDAIKHNKVRTDYVTDIAAYSDDAVYNADERLRLAELVSIIDKEIELMPPKMKEIFNLSRKRHLSHKEIADLLGVSEHTVRTQIQRALKILRSNKDLHQAILVIILNSIR